MKNAGYSDTPLFKKLGFRAGQTVFVISTPDWYSDFANDCGFELSAELPATHVHLFCDNVVDLKQFLSSVEIEDIEKSLWISWPKKASGTKTDLTEHYLRDVILPLGWVDVKVAAVDAKWSGLKFTRRKQSIR